MSHFEIGFEEEIFASVGEGSLNAY